MFDKFVNSAYLRHILPSSEYSIDLLATADHFSCPLPLSSCKTSAPCCFWLMTLPSHTDLTSGSFQKHPQYLGSGFQRAKQTLYS